MMSLCGFTIEIGERFSKEAREGWKRLLNYVGGAIIYVKSHYAERVTCLLRSWKQANHGSDKDKDAAAGEGSTSAEAAGETEATKAPAAQKKKSWNFLKSNKAGTAGA